MARAKLTWHWLVIPSLSPQMWGWLPPIACVSTCVVRERRDTSVQPSSRQVSRLLDGWHGLPRLQLRATSAQQRALTPLAVLTSVHSSG